jgi:hypothetical protein
VAAQQQQAVGRYLKTQLSGFLLYYVDGDYMFRPLCWAIIRSQEVQVRRLYSVQTLGMEHASKKFSTRSHCRYVLHHNDCLF